MSVNESNKESSSFHDEWIVAGHSFGAEIALASAAAFPERARAVIYMSCLPAATAGRRGKEEFRANRAARIPEASRDRYASGDEFLTNLRQLERPVLILHGEQDLRPMWAVERLVGKLPNAPLAWISTRPRRPNKVSCFAEHHAPFQWKNGFELVSRFSRFIDIKSPCQMSRVNPRVAKRNHEWAVNIGYYSKGCQSGMNNCKRRWGIVKADCRVITKLAIAQDHLSQISMAAPWSSQYQR